jgi:hypothetical protein
VIVPPLVTPTPTTRLRSLSADDLIPDGAEFLADAIADIGPEGTSAAVVVYRWPTWSSTIDQRIRIDVPEPQLIVRSLEGATYTPRQPRPDSPVALLVTDLNGDGLRDAVTLPVQGGATVFTNSGLRSWPRILSAADIQFYGGHLSLPTHDDRFHFSGQPVLYYAGRKQASFADVDADGRIEVDVAYSLEDGADTWQVDRYRWDGTRYIYSETWSRPAAEPVSADHYQNMLEAIEPLPEFKRDSPAERTEIQSQEIIEFDLEGDGDPEILWTYLIRPFYGTEYERIAIFGDLWLSLFDDGNRLLWQEQLHNNWDLVRLEAHIRPVRLGANSVGIVAHLLQRISGTGGHNDRWIILYEWNERALELPWQHVVEHGNSTGVGHSRSAQEAVWIQDIDGDGRVEVLLSDRIDQQMSASDPRAIRPWTVNYVFHMPGTLGLRRSLGRTTYQAAYWLQDGQVTPIRPQGPVGLAPRLSEPISIDGEDSDWHQIEHASWWGVRFWENEYYGFSPLPAAAWDERMLYLKVDAYNEYTNRSVRVALDADLFGDFDRHHLDGDDFVVQFSFSKDTPSEQAQLLVSSQVLRPRNATFEVQAAATLHGNGTCCSLEIAIPLEQLGLDGTELVPVPGWVTGGEEPNARREYYPRTGQMIGLALDLGDEVSSDVYRMDDPTTWNTLIFIADR